MAKRVSTRRVKKDRLYTYQEAGDVLGVTSHTVRAWRSSGLDVMDNSKPHFILGAVLIDYIQDKQLKRSAKGALNEMYCFTCKAQREPIGGLIDYVPITDTRGRLMGLCGICERSLHRFAAKANLGEFDGIYDIAIKCGS